MKRVLLAGASALAVAAGAGWLAAKARGQAETSAAESDNADLTRNYLMYFVVPMWVAAGVADWICHRASDIEHTGGVKESLLHLLMQAELGVPALGALFLEITSPLFALMIAAFLLHEATVLWDVAYAVSRREVTPIEQSVHSFLELVPLMAVSLLATLHWPEFLAIFGFGRALPGRRLRFKEKPLPKSYLLPLLAAIVLFEWVPYCEELVRGLRAAASPPRCGTEQARLTHD
jgi:hypothetical protein